jgi:hypothetical protein
MDRTTLGLAILSRLEDAGFTEESSHSPGAERVFAREVRKGMNVKVFTSVVGVNARDCGADAIRVSSVYTKRDGGTRGVAKERRVNRTGNVEEIVERMVGRMRDAWTTTRNIPCCSSCGAPKFVAKSGNTVCAEICWLTPEERERSSREYSSRRKSTGKRKSSWKTPKAWKNTTRRWR